MKCPMCTSTNISVGVDLLFYIPFKDFRKVTKKKLQKKEFELWGANWNQASFVCKDCMYSWEPFCKMSVIPINQVEVKNDENKEIFSITGNCPTCNDGTLINNSYNFCHRCGDQLNWRKP